MSKIKRANEITIQSNLKMMLYGVPGSGKSTLALSAPNPLLLDFDNGVKRINKSHLATAGILQIESWKDIVDLLSQDINEVMTYDTIVVDTVGKMMDFIVAGVCGSKQPQIRDWGRINEQFKWFIRTISNLGKDIIFVAHADKRKEGDNTIYFPMLRDKSYNTIVTELDLLGFVEMKDDRGTQIRTVEFNPTNRNDGKNTCQMPSGMKIDNIVDANGNSTSSNNYVERVIIPKYRSMIGEKEKDIMAYNELLNELQDGVEQITDAQSANEFAKQMEEYKSHDSSVLVHARKMFKEKVGALGLVYNKETKMFEDKAA